MYVRYSARRSLFGALIGVLGDMDVSQVEYACIINVCIYRRADSTGSTIYVCTHACMYVLCMHACMYAIRRADIGALIGALCGIDMSQVKYACIENVCIYRRADSTGSTIYVCMYAYVCTPIGAPFGRPIANRRADRRAVWYRCVPS